MNDIFKPLAVACLLAVALPVSAQTTTTEEPAEGTEDPAAGLDMGQTVAEGNAVPEIYVRETHGDWEVRCVRAETPPERCQVHQTLKGPDDTSVAEVSMFPLPENEQAAAGATVAVPLLTLLTEQLTLTIDGGDAKRYNFTWCDQEGCYARIGFTSADIASFKAGAGATVTIVPVAAADQKVEVPMSLSGFTAAYDALSAE